MNRMRTEIEKYALGPVQLDGEGGVRSFRFTEEFIGFAGHFPGYPILPAVLQSLLAQLVAEQVVGEPLRFLSLERAKFTRQLRPGEQITVSVKPQLKQEQLYCTCELQAAEQRAASFKLVLGNGAM